MNDTDGFLKRLTGLERRRLEQLTSPARIQAFLDELAYNHEDSYRCPLRVLRDRMAHCYDGAVFAAAALGRLGYPPLPRSDTGESAELNDGDGVGLQ